jgi:hypothetical protein
LAREIYLGGPPQEESVWPGHEIQFEQRIDLDSRKYSADEPSGGLDAYAIFRGKWGGDRRLLPGELSGERPIGFSDRAG